MKNTKASMVLGISIIILIFLVGFFPIGRGKSSNKPTFKVGDCVAISDEYKEEFSTEKSVCRIEELGSKSYRMSLWIEKEHAFFETKSYPLTITFLQANIFEKIECPQ